MEQEPKKEQRLAFIDIARSIAILMMLEGHFIVMSLQDKFRSDDYFIYSIWKFTRGFTAPLFFTVSGLVFTYLLVRKNKPFFHNERVRKGLKRGVQLLFWGYFLQVNLYYLLQGYFSGYLFIFHVLQCIGLSLIIIIVFSGIQSLVRFIPLSLWLGIVGFLGFILRPTIYSLDFSGVHPIIENILVVASDDRPFKSIFALFPWVGFVAFGGMMGAYLSVHAAKVYTNRYVLILFLTGLILNIFPGVLLKMIQPYFMFLGLKPFAHMGYLFARLGQVFLAFSLIIFIGIYKPYFKHIFSTKLVVFQTWVIPITSAILGLSIIAYSYLTGSQYHIFSTLTLYAFGNLLLFIALVYTLAKLIPWNFELFLKMGQKTLSIYIIHVIILYGGIFGFGLSDFLSSKLHPWGSVIGAMLFMTLFVYFIKYYEFFDNYYQKIFFWKKKD
ncbi:MAG: DUF1624 domain-containing protein [Brumimicrobium sp.]|nr:DUF1624 domain-containing protein [Brumimicrobium sp.]MCO5267336.1 DUF1624 domain-containing protein [Brumimicrobium sp.]